MDLDQLVRDLDLSEQPPGPERVTVGRRVYWRTVRPAYVMVEHRPSGYSVRLQDGQVYVTRPAARGCGLTTTESARSVERAQRDGRVEVRDAVEVASRG